MPDLTPDIVGSVIEACKAGSTEASEAFSRGIDAELQLTVGDPGTIDTRALPDGFSGPGLAIVLNVGSEGVLLLIPEEEGLLPDWVANPDPTEKSQLTTLAQELGMILLPEEYMPDDFRAARVKALSGALARGGVANGAAIVPLELETSNGRKGHAGLIWPAANPAAVIGAGGPTSRSKPDQKPKTKPTPELGSAAPPKPRRRRPATIAGLPEYSRSLLRIQLPVVVTLAEKQQPLERIMELGPGSIIQFDKSCEEMLELDVGGQAVATGEAVKVGDKFGLRINAIILPEERFASLRPAESADQSERDDAPSRVVTGRR